MQESRSQAAPLQAGLQSAQPIFWHKLWELLCKQHCAPEPSQQHLHNDVPAVKTCPAWQHRTPQQAAAGLGNFEAAGSRDILRDLVHWNPDSNGCTEMCEPEKEPQ